MRRLLPMVAGLLLVLGIPTAATAGAATKYTDHAISLYCDGMTATSGGGFAFFSANVSDHFGSDGYVDFWAGGTPVGRSDLTRDFDQPATVTWDGTTIAGSIPLIHKDGSAAAPATFSATMTPLGDPSPFDDSFKDGNQKYRASGTTRQLDPDGTLLIGTSTFTLGPCGGDDTTVTVFSTNPKSSVSSFSDHSVACDISNDHGDTGSLFTSLDPGDTFVDANVTPAGGGQAVGASGAGQLVNGVLDTTLDTYDPDTGQPVAGGGSIHLVVAAVGDRFDNLLDDGVTRIRFRGVTLDIEGTLTVDGMTFDLGHCIGVDARAKRIVTFSSGPKPGGKVPTNDKPSGATTLKVGARTSVATKGASPDREADYTCLQSVDENGVPFEDPVGFTVWYKIVGTGGSITVNTAGSDYDTVAAVYTASGGAYTPVPDACVDDVPTVPVGRTVQAAVTWATTSGTVYYVQIGGYPGPVPFGNLKVAVR